MRDIYYAVITHNDDMGNDDDTTFNDIISAYKFYEQYVNDYIEDGVHGSVELLQVNKSTLEHKQIKYWNSYNIGAGRE
jgi:hypothetical protein